MYSLTVDHPDFPKGTVFSVPDLLGVEVVNGETVEVSEDTAKSYKERTGQTLSESFKVGNITVKRNAQKGGEK